MKSENDKPPFHIRLATINDLTSLTELHCASFGPDDNIPASISKDYVRATYRWLITSGQSYCLVADAGQKIIGLAGTCDGPYTRPMFFACLPEFIRSFVRSPGLIFQKHLRDRLLHSFNILESRNRIASYPGFAQMTIGAVDAEYRGAGIFPALVEASKAHSKGRGSRAIRAGVYKQNAPSRRVFLKGGWIETPELETGDLVFYVHFIDPDFPHKLGLTMPKDVQGDKGANR